MEFRMSVQPTIVSYAGDGSTKNFTFQFDYLNTDYVKVRVDGTDVPFSFTSTKAISVSTAPQAGETLVISRETDRERLVDFTDGSVLIEDDLDLSALQVLHIVQEALDLAGASLTLKADGSLGASFRRLSEVGDPVDDHDVVNKVWAETAMSSQLSQAITARTASEAARDASIAARDVSTAAKNTAVTAKDNAVTAEAGAIAAAASATLSASEADSHKAAAQAAKGAAETARDVALGYRNEAEGFKNAAATFDPALFLAKSDNLSGLTDKATARAALELQSAAQKAAGTAAGNVPVLDGSGKLDVGVLPEVQSGPVALASINGVGGATIRSQNGFSSIIYMGVGIYQFNFSVARVDANYIINATSGGLALGNRAVAQIYDVQTTGFRVYTQNHGNAAQTDAGWVCVTVWEV
jgi:hypothetical protein